MFKVKLIRHVFGAGMNEFSVTMVRNVELPFPPVPGIGLGPYEWSEPASDVLRVERVMYNIPRGQFHVEVDSFRINEPKDIVRFMIANGWELDLSIPFTTPEEAESVEPGLYTIVEVEGRYYPLSRAELWCLREQKTAHRVVKEPS